MEIEKLDDKLYRAIYEKPRFGDYNEIWNEIKNDPDILREAVQVIRDKFDERDTVKGITIAETMLIDYENVDEVAYNNLISSIYRNKDIARIVLDGASNGGFSFLLMSLWNHNLRLTDEQKLFAVNEAMNKIGTTRWMDKNTNFSKKLDDMGINNDDTIFVSIDGSINPIGCKSGCEYVNYMFSSLSDDQAHGTGEFDIRYQILRNPNWTLDEKKQLVMDFWCDDEVYDETLEQWEWKVINDTEYRSNGLPLIEKEDLYEYSYDVILKIYGDKKKADKVWEDIQFCKQMHMLRPQQWELESMQKKKVLSLHPTI